MSELNKIALKIMSGGKGILAADESNGTMTKRLEAVNVTSNTENRLLFRETLFSSESMKKYIGGVILYDETINQTTNFGKSIPELISSSGAIPGIKVDTGAKSLANSSEEKITEGLDGLRERLNKYYELGARFTKWRGVYAISDKYPSKLSINSNAHALARYSALAQESKMVPIVEPEVLMDGNHSADMCLSKTSEVIKKCFEELILHKVDLSGIILKPNMILAGSQSKRKILSEEVAKKTLECLKNSVPDEVPGIAFLSGGQTEIEATENLNSINKYNNTN
ncbi:fructose-bisphosphate aldolase class I, partial [Candidatus Pelagibacter sp.]|nr:fructose-bisphosphate aldolase class I [Candidatus Pelagibacter sp.]